MVGCAADHFGNEAGEALTEGLPIKVGCHNGKEEAKCILICRWYGLSVAVALQGETGIGFIPFVLEMEPRALCTLDKCFATQPPPAPQ